MSDRIPCFDNSCPTSQDSSELAQGEGSLEMDVCHSRTGGETTVDAVVTVMMGVMGVARVVMR